MKGTAEAIASVQNTLSLLPTTLSEFNFECQTKIDAEIEKNSKLKIKRTGAECVQFLESVFAERDNYVAQLVDELEAVVKFSKSSMKAVERVIAALRHDDKKITRDLVFDAIAELEAIRIPATIASKKSEDLHAITKWYRKNYLKYPSQAEAIRFYASRYDGNFDKLKNQLNNDGKRNPLPKPPKRN